MVEEAHAAVADLLGAARPTRSSSATTCRRLTLHIGRCIGATLSPGDEIVVTTLDHEANVSTWEAMAADRGVTVRKVDIREDDVTLDLEDLESKLVEADQARRRRLRQQRGRDDQPGQRDRRPRPRGRRADLRRRGRLRPARPDRRPGARHRLPRDCCAYKWFGPHLGALYGKADVLDALPAFKVRPAEDRFETGTAAFESIAGTLAATDYLRDVGRAYGDVAGAPGAAAAATPSRARRRHDRHRRLRARPRHAGSSTGSARSAGVTIHGITDPARADERVPTVSISIDGVQPRAAAERSAARASSSGTATSTRPG